MTQLLISVKNVEESRIARYAGVDLIDLKDPGVGALGALPVDVVKQIVQDGTGSALVSATVGEGHATTEALMNDIALYASLGVDVVKVAVSALFQQADFFDGIKTLTERGIKIVAVMFAEKALDFSLIAKLQQSGFYGVMVDTQFKYATLLERQSMEALGNFIVACRQQKLVSGLAGSVNKQHIDTLLTLRPSFIGMRGGVCHQQDRTAMLLDERIVEIREMLLNCNNDLMPALV